MKSSHLMVRLAGAALGAVLAAAPQATWAQAAGAGDRTGVQERVEGTAGPPSAVGPPASPSLSGDEPAGRVVPFVLEPPPKLAPPEATEADQPKPAAVQRAAPSAAGEPGRQADGKDQAAAGLPGRQVPPPTAAPASSPAGPGKLTEREREVAEVFGCPRGKVARMLETAVEEAEISASLGLELEIIQFCRDRWQVVDDVLKAEFDLAKVLREDHVAREKAAIALEERRRLARARIEGARLGAAAAAKEVEERKLLAMAATEPVEPAEPAEEVEPEPGPETVVIVEAPEPETHEVYGWFSIIGRAGELQAGCDGRQRQVVGSGRRRASGWSADYGDIGEAAPGPVRGRAGFGVAAPEAQVMDGLTKFLVLLGLKERPPSVDERGLVQWGRMDADFRSKCVVWADGRTIIAEGYTTDPHVHEVLRGVRESGVVPGGLREKRGSVEDVAAAWRGGQASRGSRMADQQLVEKLYGILEDAVEAEADDVIFWNREDDCQVFVQVNNRRLPLGTPLTKAEGDWMIHHLFYCKTEGSKQVSFVKSEQQGWGVGPDELRMPEKIAALRCESGPNVTSDHLSVRIFPKDRIKEDTTLEKLGFNGEILEIFREIRMSKYGAVIIAGPTGEGKSTTNTVNMMTQMKEHNNELHMATAEDPVENRMRWVIQIQMPTGGVEEDREKTFEKVLRHFVRIHPQVGGWGEIRDLSSAKLALQFVGFRPPALHDRAFAQCERSDVPPARYGRRGGAAGEAREYPAGDEPAADVDDLSGLRAEEPGRRAPAAVGAQRDAGSGGSLPQPGGVQDLSGGARDGAREDGMGRLPEPVGVRGVDPSG